ncbi:C40 family peptidase [Pseudorhodoferax soli]|uniref:NlpC/P60 family protein n=1 Tax=Pseudorhodoferax soli TaxID=545864 RepID=A0A368X8F0_9BURK|nr:C40 family peptidase [Pseudorhodoferax soli]RCW64125.1 NlpC/P60 family protein [Pseudorhodoferax soli]
MPRWTAVFILACCVASAAQAAPPESSLPAASPEMPADMQRALAERGLVRQTLGHIEQVGQTMRDTTSDLVGTAMGFLGVPYRRGGNSAESGFDCSGFVRAVYSQTVGLVLPRRANEQAAATDTIEKRDLQPGDLVFFNTMRRTFSHVGIYVGDGKFVHAPRSGAKVRVEDMDSSYWKRRFDGARRVETDTPLDASALTKLGAGGN